MTRQATSPLVVLGSGYTGHVLHRTGTSKGWTVHTTIRNTLNNLADIPSEQRLRFDLEQPSTWSNFLSALISSGVFRPQCSRRCGTSYAGSPGHLDAS